MSPRTPGHCGRDPSISTTPTASGSNTCGDGTSRVYGVNLQGAYGVTDRLMVLAGLPYLWFELADDAVRDAGRSPGDLRVDVRWQPLRVNEFAAAVQAGVKLPTATDRDPTQAQVGEGQLDFDLTGSIGRRWGPLVWASVDGGYRWRRRNGSTGIKPGDEWIYRLELGADITPTVSVTTQFGGFAGRQGSARAFGFDLPTVTKRRVARLGPTLAWRLHPNWQLSLTASLPLAGAAAVCGTPVHHRPGLQPVSPGAVERHGQLLEPDERVLLLDPIGRQTPRSYSEENTEMNDNRTTQSGGATTGGILSMVLASTCCVLPVALAVAGLGGLGLGAFFGEYHWYFLASASAL